MAKRNAASELNHDNWEEEDEKEEAGEFLKASEEQMKVESQTLVHVYLILFVFKGRVIKKAKRRNLNEDQKKNIFNSFGGFSSTNNVSASDAFSFLATQATNGSTSANGTKTEETGPQPAAAISPLKPEAEAKSSFSSGFVFGNSKTAAPTSSVFGFIQEKKSESQATDQTPPDDLPQSSPSNPETQSSAPTAPAPDDLFAKFMKKSSGKWTCDICMISNEADKTSCLACETPKPGCQPSAAPTESAAPKAETKEFKFGFTPSQTEVKDSSTASGFKFGGSDEGGTAGGGFGGFKFGTSTNSETKATGGFQFGTSSDPGSKSTGGFQFGTSTNTESKSTGGLQFGTSADSENKSNGGFQFGASTNPESKENGGFQFGTSSNTESRGFQPLAATPNSEPETELVAKQDTAVATTETPSKSKKGEYLSSLKSLNTQVTSWIKTHVDQNPLIDLTPVFKDYEKHIGSLRTKYNISGSASKAKEATKPLTVAPTPSPFSSAFGSNQTFKAGFQFGFESAKETKSEDKENDRIEKEDDEEGSPKKPADPVVEEDAIYSKKCKLFYKKDGEYVGKGLGNLYLKLTDEKKLQLVIRADNSLGNILLNTLISPTTPLERLGKNNVMLLAVANPPIDPKTESEPVTFLVRVKTAEDADELKLKMVGLCKN